MSPVTAKEDLGEAVLSSYIAAKDVLAALQSVLVLKVDVSNGWRSI